VRPVPTIFLKSAWKGIALMKATSLPKTVDQTRTRAMSLAIRQLLVVSDPDFYNQTIKGIEAVKSGKRISLQDFMKKIGR
jgi:hypothetical protein